MAPRPSWSAPWPGPSGTEGCLPWGTGRSPSLTGRVACRPRMCPALVSAAARRGTLAEWIPEWRARGAPPELLAFLRAEEFPLWVEAAPAYFDNRVEPQDVDFVDTTIANWLLLGKIRPWTTDDDGPAVVVAPLSVVQSGAAGKSRVIYNGSYSSYGEADRPTPMMLLPEYLRRVERMAARARKRRLQLFGLVLDMKGTVSTSPPSRPRPSPVQFSFGRGSSTPSASSPSASSRR